jgi:hypothetical protein
MADGAPSTIGDVQPVAVQHTFPFWRAPWEFAVHGILGTLIFGIIAVLAVALDVSVGWLEAHRISALVIFGLRHGPKTRSHGKAQVLHFGHPLMHFSQVGP